MATARRGFFLVLVLCLMFFLPSAIHAQNASVVLSVEPANPANTTVNLPANEFFTAKVNLQNPSSQYNIFFYRFLLSYDQRYIQLIPNDTIPSDKFPAPVRNTPTGHSLEYSQARFDGSGVSDALVSLATFRFRALRPTNTTRISLSTVDIWAYNASQKLPVRIQNASYKITSNQTGTDTSSCSVCAGKTLCFCWFNPFR